MGMVVNALGEIIGKNATIRTIDGDQHTFLVEDVTEEIISVKDGDSHRRYYPISSVAWIDVEN